jgi:hypothetical protein
MEENYLIRGSRDNTTKLSTDLSSKKNFSLLRQPSTDELYSSISPKSKKKLLPLKPTIKILETPTLQEYQLALLNWEK